MYDKNLTQVRRRAAVYIHDIALRNETKFEDIIVSIVRYLKDYENEYSDCMKHLNDNDTQKKTWTFWNSMFYAGTIFTTIEGEESPGPREGDIVEGPVLSPRSEPDDEFHEAEADLNNDRVEGTRNRLRPLPRVDYKRFF
ncbi:unnamed protein product, partial [Iphiclides podalirius]